MAEKSGVYKYYNGKEYDDIYFKTKASLVAEDDNHKFVSKSDIAKWNGKADVTKASASTDGLMSKEDKNKLDNIPKDANSYKHPTTSGSKHIPEGGKSNQVLVYKSDGDAKWAYPYYQEYIGKENKEIVTKINKIKEEVNIIHVQYFCCNKTNISPVRLSINGTAQITENAGGRMRMDVYLTKMEKSTWLINWRCSYVNAQINDLNKIWERSKTIILNSSTSIDKVTIDTAGTADFFEPLRVLVQMY